jgi:hypothetical protein
MATVAVGQAPIRRPRRAHLPAEFRSQMPTRRRRAGGITTGRACPVSAGAGGDLRTVRSYLPGVTGRFALAALWAGAESAAAAEVSIDRQHAAPHGRGGCDGGGGQPTL